MHYLNEIEINLPVSKVVELFDNPENMKQWQPNLINFEHISGTAGEPGAKSKLTYKMGNRLVEMIEIISVRNLPDEFSGTYEMTGIHTFVKNHFIPIGENKTKYVSESKYQFKGFMKIFGFLMRKNFEKQTQHLLESFKLFAEQHG